MTPQAAFIFEHVGPKGFALEFGANDGLFLSNTIDLERAGWEVLCVEANPLYGPFLWANRGQAVIAAVGTTEGPATLYLSRESDGPAGLEYASWTSLNPRNGAVGTAPVYVRSINWFLERWNPPSLDALFLDIEGTEGEVLASLDFSRWRPKAICVENWDKNGKHLATLEPQGYSLSFRHEFDEVYLVK